MEPQIYSQLVRNTGDNLDCNWHLEGGAVLWDLMLSPGR